MKISAASPNKAKRELEVDYPFDEEDVQKNIAAFGEKVVNSGFLKSAVIDVQARVRRNLEKGLDGKGERMSDEAIVADIAAWKPGVSVIRTKVDKVQAALDAFEGMDEAAQNEMLAKFLAKAKGGPQA
jgi:hypothetical protein